MNAYHLMAEPLWTPISPLEEAKLALPGLEGPEEVTVTIHYVGVLSALAGCDISVQRFSAGTTLRRVMGSVAETSERLGRVFATTEGLQAYVDGREAILEEPLLRDVTVVLMASGVGLKGLSGAHTGRPCLIQLNPLMDPSFN